MHNSSFVGLFAVHLLISNAEYLPGLNTQLPQLSTFFTLLIGTDNLYNLVAPGGVTILAPTNDAFSALALNTTNKEEVGALLRYHILRGIHSSDSIDSSVSFLPTLLQDEEYTNVTGGQVVEGRGGNGELVSAVFGKSKIITPDIIYINGLVHSIDTVLKIPQSYSSTITAASLTSYIGLLETIESDWIKHTRLLLDLAVSPDMTIFCTNSPQYSSNYTGLENLSYQQQLEIFGYHTINGSILYSTNLTNGSSFTTSIGKNLTAWVDDNDDLYINNAKVLEPDLLFSNGVLQVIDRILDPNDTNAVPNLASSITTNRSSNVNGLSTAALAGIVVGSVVGFVIVCITAYRVLRRRRTRKKARNPHDARCGRQNSATDVAPPIPINSKPSVQAHEMETRPIEMETKWNTWELAKPEGSAPVYVDRHELPTTDWI